MSEKDQPQDDSLAARLGRASARAVKQARPHGKRLAADAKPLLDKAAQYAATHHDELRDAGTKLVRGRLRGPLAMAFDAIAGPEPSNTASTELECTACGALNPPASRFCNQCASPLARS